MPKQPRSTILFVDDNSQQAFAIGSTLHLLAKTRNIALKVYTDADEALHFVKDEDGLLLQGAIVDLWMLDKATGIEDQKKGEEIIAQILLRFPSARVVVLSGHMDDATRRYFSAKNIRSLNKPCTAREIFDEVAPSQ